jgi:sporulation protein YlmC with PRC-barrel domain
MLKKVIVLALLVTASFASVRGAAAQVAGEAPVGVTVEETKLVVLGWSAKHKLLGHDVYNDKNEKIGKIDDIIVSPKKTASWAIIGVGGFLGIASKDVAIPMDHLHFDGDKLILPGATKDELKSLPPFQVAK